MIGNFGPRRVRLAVSAELWQGGLSSAILREIRDAGYAGCEYCLADGDKNLKKLFAKQAVDFVPGIWSGSMLDSSVEEEMERIEGWARQLSQIKAGMIVYAEGFHDGCSGEKRRQLESDEYKSYGSKLSKLARNLKRNGLRLVFAHAPETAIATADEVATLMDHTAATVSLQIDTGWLAASGGAMITLVRRYASRISHLCCRDLVADGSYAVPGEGKINFRELFKTLAAIKYGGWIVVAGAKAEANAMILAINGREHLEPLLDENSLAVLDEQD